MIETKEQLIEIVKAILEKKAFSQKAKENLLMSIVFAYEFYRPPKYIKTSRDEYIMEYLKVLEDMRGYAIVELEELNEENEVSEEFRTSIKKSETGDGNLDFIDGKYIPCEKGAYKCTCKGFAWNREKMIFTLNEHHYAAEMETIHHEMTHLTEGKYPFLISSSIPFSFELRKMLYEGRAATRESYIQTATSYVQIEVLEDSNTSYKIESLYSYPLYNKLYQTLQLIFGEEFLEEMSKNEEREFDMIEEMKKRFPEFPVHEIISHIIYILSCTSKDSHNILATSIHYFARNHSKNIEGLQEKILSENRNLNFCRNALKESQEKEREIKATLESPEKLKEEYQKAKENAKMDIIAMYKEGYYKEKAYREELARLEQEGTLEYYIEVKKQELIDNKRYQEATEKSIEEAIQNLERLRAEKAALESNQFAFVLEKICLKQPSLGASFSFLEEIALKKIREEESALSEEERTTSEKQDKLLDKIKKLLELKERTYAITQKKASLVS